MTAVEKEQIDIICLKYEMHLFLYTYRSHIRDFTHLLVQFGFSNFF